MATTADAMKVPQGVRRGVNAMYQRQWGIRFAEGLMITVGAGALALLAALALDWLFAPRSLAVRCTLTGCAVVAIGWVAVRYWLARMTAIRRMAAAAAIEQAIPALEERWSTVMELSGSKDPEAVRGAPSLIRQVREEAEAMAETIKVDRIEVRSGLRNWGLGALGACVLLLVFLLSAGNAGRLLQRFAFPMIPMPLTRLALVDGDRVAAVGEPLALEAGVSGRLPARAELQIREAGDARAEVQVVSLARTDAPQPHFSHSIATLKRSFEYRLEAGDGETPWHTVTAIERPQISAVAFSVTPPVYSRLPIDIQQALPRNCRALEGSRLEVALQASKPLETATLQFADERTETLVADADGWYRFSTTLTDSLTFTPQLTDGYGLSSENAPTCRVYVYGDLPPTVEFVAPKNDVRLLPDSKVTLEIEARDDLGLRTAQLTTTIQRKDGTVETQVRELDLGRRGEHNASDASQADAEAGDADPNRSDRQADGENADDAPVTEFKQRIELDLAELNLADGDRMQATVEVTDTRAMQSEASSAMANNEAQQQQQQAAAGQPGETGERVETPDAERREQENRDRETADAEQRNIDGKSGKTPQVDPKDAAAAKAKAGEPTPPNPLDQRLAFGPAGSCSSSVRIKVDKWAGDYEGEQRAKLQLAIDKYLEALKAKLGEAEVATGQTTAAIDKAGAWDGPAKLGTHSAEKSVGEAEETVDEVFEKSQGSPYAFVGLALKDIDLQHIAPARGHLGRALVDAAAAIGEKRMLVDQASYNIRRALEKLNAVTERYETAKREEDWKERLIEFARMHRLFIEDTYAFLKKSNPSLNPRDSRYGTEVDEEFAKALEERYEKLNELLRQLSALMAEDPNLMRRAMAMFNLQGTTLRDQLTLLQQRQQGINGRMSAWLTADAQTRPSALEALTQAHVGEKGELATLANDLHVGYLTWKPRDLTDAAPPIAQGQALTEQVALAEDAIARDPSPIDSKLSRTQSILSQLEQLDGALAQAMDSGDAAQTLPHFVAGRLGESRTLAARETGWRTKIEALRAGNPPAAESVDQGRLMADTLTLGDKLNNVKTSLAEFSPEIGVKAGELVELVSREIPASQMMAGVEIAKGQPDRAAIAQTEALKQYQIAEAKFDELLTMVEDMASTAPAPTAAQICPAPDLETLLKMLEQEMQACEKLGAAGRLANLQMNFDWFSQGQGSGGGSGGSGSGMSGRSGQGQSGSRGQGNRQRDNRLAEAMARAAQQLAGNGQRALSQIPGMPEDGVPGDPSNLGRDAAGRKWNVLASKLDDELNQSRQNVAPEAYRQAIDDYFRNLAAMASEQ